jgi:hypothetical protein
VNDSNYGQCACQSIRGAQFLLLRKKTVHPAGSSPKKCRFHIKKPDSSFAPTNSKFASYCLFTNAIDYYIIYLLFDHHENQITFSKLFIMTAHLSLVVILIIAVLIAIESLLPVWAVEVQREIR